MTPPSGEIVSRPMLVRACGCVQEFQYFAVDRYRKERQAKFESTRCPECAAKLIQSQRIPSKNEAFDGLPTGTQLTLNRLPDGSWSGTLATDGTMVEATAPRLQSLTIALAQLWWTQRATT